MSTDDHSIEALLARHSTAVAAKDVDAFVSLYCDDVRIFDTWESWSLEAKSVWASMVAEWFRSLGSDHLKVEFTGVHVVSSGDIASLQAFVSYTAFSPEGQELRSMVTG